MMMSADEVAEIGVRAMLRRKAVVTPGLLNALTAWSVKMIPRSMATAAAGISMKAKREGT